MAKVVFATYQGNGWIEARNPFDQRLLADNYNQGDEIKLTITNPRSIKHLNYFFVWLKEIYANLPENCHLRFRNQEHLRAYFVYKSGYCDCFTIPSDSFDKNVISLLRQISRRKKDDNDELFFERSSGGIFVFIPKSISFQKMGQDEFLDFFNHAKVFAQELIPGIDLKALEKRLYEEYLQKRGM